MSNAKKQGPVTVDGKTLWTNSGGASPFAKLHTPSNLKELARRVAEDARAESDARVKPYRTPVTNDTLRSPVK